MMKCPCRESCDLRIDLEKSEDKMCFLDENCLPSRIEEKYSLLDKETLQCSICLIEVVRDAIGRGDLSVDCGQSGRLDRIRNFATYYYVLYDLIHPARKPTLWEKLRCWWQRLLDI